MGGLAGFWDRRCQGVEPRLFAMTNALRHRGPDGAGYWLDARQGVALGHRRLEVIKGRKGQGQPVFSRDGRYALILDGRIYDGPSFGGLPGSSGERIVEAVSRWGLSGALERLRGEFAFVLWDREEALLSLVGDPLGGKPIYYGILGELFLFGSELKALLASPEGEVTIDEGALASFLRYSAVSAPATIYQEIRKVCPGEVVEVSGPEWGAVRRRRWWRSAEVVESAREFLFVGSDEQTKEALKELLFEAVGRRMRSGEEVGAFLSGGIDSATVVAVMQAQSVRPVKTFSLGFEDERFDEAESAALVAGHLGTEHHCHRVGAKEIQAVIERLPTLFDEPFGDSSQLATFLVSQFAAEHIGVVLGGDGGDELFGGYNRHVWGPRVWGAMHGLPRKVRKMLSGAVLSKSPASWDDFFQRFGRWIPRRARVTQAGDKLQKLAGALGAMDADDLYQILSSPWVNPAPVLRSGGDGRRIFEEEPYLEEIAEQWMYRDLVGYLPDDILTKVDRATMGSGLEARVPLLDLAVVEFAWRLPLAMKIREGQGKWILRQVLYDFVPRELMERPKMGFGVPLDAWLRRELRPWAEELLETYRLAESGLFEVGPIQQMWAEHLRGERNWAQPLWNLLVFEDWRHRAQTGQIREVPSAGWEQLP